ncbi:MAG: SDR family NAD(P)-dependent oxidoreductase [Fuerstiella sp.]
MDLKLSNNTVVIVGGASGIGKACAESFLAEGAIVSIWDSSPTVTEVANELLCSGLQVDIADESAVCDALHITEQQQGPTQHVVNAAAIGSGGLGMPFTSLKPGDWQRVIDVNINGMVNVAHAFTAGMMERKDGTFVFIASVAGQIGSPTDPPYSASKAANINFAQVMAKDLAPHKVRVNTVCPGMVKTPLNQNVWRSWNERQPEGKKLSYEAWAELKIRQLVPLGTWQQPSDIANMVAFLSSDCACQITGQTINVDGGYVMHS